jgi:hypothetical protein
VFFGLALSPCGAVDGDLLEVGNPGRWGALALHRFEVVAVLGAETKRE